MHLSYISFHSVHASPAPVIFINMRKFTEYKLYIRGVGLQKRLEAKYTNETLRGNNSEPFQIRTDEDGLLI